jgi:hypothetical protein
MSQHLGADHAARMRLRDRVRGSLRRLRDGARPAPSHWPVYRPVVPQLRDYPVARRR